MVTFFDKSVSVVHLSRASEELVWLMLTVSALWFWLPYQGLSLNVALQQTGRAPGMATPSATAVTLRIWNNCNMDLWSKNGSDRCGGVTKTVQCDGLIRSSVG